MVLRYSYQFVDTTESFMREKRGGGVSWFSGIVTKFPVVFVRYDDIPH